MTGMYFKVLALLRRRGIDDHDDAFRLGDLAQGDGPFVETWDEGLLGPSPSAEDLAAIPEDEEAALQEAHVARLTEAASPAYRKEVLASCAVVVRSRDVAAWNAMTDKQRLEAVRAEAEAVRSFVESTL